MDQIVTKQSTTIHRVSLEEMAAFGNVALVEEIDRVKALAEMYRLHAGDNPYNLILWFDPEVPANRPLPDDILSGWESDIYIDPQPIQDAVEEMTWQIEAELEENGAFRGNQSVFTEYTQSFVFDLEKAFQGTELSMNAFTAQIHDSETTHPDTGIKHDVRFLTTLYGDRTFFADNNDVARGEYGWGFGDTVDRHLYVPPEGVVTLPAKEHQKPVPNVHSIPYSEDENDPKDRYVLITDVRMPAY